MTPEAIAKSYCSNWDGGKCTGVYYNDDMSIKFCKPLPKCLLSLDPIKRCAYFEECVAPIKLKDERKKAEFSAGVAQYHAEAP